jgi:Tfp pilus assembly protein FimT
MVVVAIIGVILRISLPSIQNTILVYRLGAAASSVAAAINQNRYQSVMIGCPYTVAFTAGSTTYEVQTQAISGTPPACATNADGSPKFTDVTPGPAIISWTSGAGVSLSPSTTFTFTANGIVSATQGGSNCAMPCSFKVSNTQGATRTILVSGVGNVKVTTP